MFADEGPGIPDLELAMRNGYTTGDGLGLGLGGGQAAGQRLRHPDHAGAWHHGDGGDVGLTAPLRFGVSDPSGVAPVRRAAARLASTLGFSEEDAGRAATVATELATNLVAHATDGGEVILRTGRAGADHNGPLDIIAWDRGPGMADVERCLQDGFSSGGWGSRHRPRGDPSDERPAGDLQHRAGRDRRRRPDRTGAGQPG